MKAEPEFLNDRLLDWLLASDVAIQYQVHRDLLDEERSDLRARIATEGWGAQFLAARRPDGHWGRGFYQPKWTSTHYTLLDLRHLCIAPDHALIRESVANVLARHKGVDGGVNPARSIPLSDVCVSGMALEYGRRGYAYRAAELEQAAVAAREFILQHRLFRSDHTGAIINPSFLRLSYPARWFYDILRGLDYFGSTGAGYDPRMQDALDVLLQKRRKDGAWPLQARHAGQVHFDMETPGQPSRWNTLRALRVLRRLGQLDQIPPM